MAGPDKETKQILRGLRWPLRLTHAGMIAESLGRSFWPLLSLVLLILAGLMLGVGTQLSVGAFWAAAVGSGFGLLACLIWGGWRFHWPTASDAQGRLDASLSGHPIAAILDTQLIGANDPQSRHVWNAHLERMARRTQNAAAVRPDLRLAERDPYAIRYVAVLVFAIALIFGSVLRLTEVESFGLGASAPVASASWEGWVEPPSYTRKPSIYLADISDKALAVPVGSHVTLRLYGDVGALNVSETVSGRTEGIESSSGELQNFIITQSGEISVLGTGGQSWSITALADQAPEIRLAGELERSASGEFKLPYAVKDDYGVASGRVEISLDLAAVTRVYSFATDPEPRSQIVLDLPVPFRGDRSNFEELLVDDLSRHAWAGLPVSMTLFATDAAGNVGQSETETVFLPGRRFFDPLAAAFVEQRQHLLWSRENAQSVAQVLRAVSHRPQEIFPAGKDYLKLSVVIRRLEAALQDDLISNEVQDEVALALWDMAVLLEDGDLAGARERLRQAEERLEQAMRDGATDDEIAKLMQDLNEAMQDYIDQLAREQNEQDSQNAQNQNSQEVTNQDLQEMLDRIQELMEQGRMAEAQELMEQLRELMENMQVTQGNQGQKTPGEQRLDDLEDTLREQQELSDETFKDLQEQFSERGQQNDAGQQPGGQSEQPGEGEGQDSQEQQGQGDQGGQQGNQGSRGLDGMGDQPGEGDGQGGGDAPSQGLAGRQQALREQLDGQSQNMPGGNSRGGSNAQDSIDQAGRAMEGAEEALRQDDLAGALDEQSNALEAMRQGMRDLAEELSQQQSNQTGQQGDAFGRAQNEVQRDPLGRDAGAAGRIGTDQELLQGDDVYRDAQKLLEEIRRRSSEQQRSPMELDYLKRLLERF